MANFKVGDRVRKIAQDPERQFAHVTPVGAEGVIRGRAEWRGRSYWLVEYPGFEVPEWQVTIFGRYFYNASFQIAPLTPPAEDAWAADAVRKVTKPQHVEPVVVKERA